MKLLFIFLIKTKYFVKFGLFIFIDRVDRTQ